MKIVCDLNGESVIDQINYIETHLNGFVKALDESVMNDFMFIFEIILENNDQFDALCLELNDIGHCYLVKIFMISMERYLNDCDIRTYSAYMTHSTYSTFPTYSRSIDTEYE